MEIDGGGWSEMSTFKVWDHLQSARTLREYHYIYIVQLSLVSKPIQKIDRKFTTCTISAPYITGNDREYARRKFVSIVYKGFWNFQCKKAEGGMSEETKITAQNDARVTGSYGPFSRSIAH